MGKKRIRRKSKTDYKKKVRLVYIVVNGLMKEEEFLFIALC